MLGLLRAIEASSFEVILACAALFRPSPLWSGLTERYKAIARGEDYETHDDKRPLLVRDAFEFGIKVKTFGINLSTGRCELNYEENAVVAPLQAFARTSCLPVAPCPVRPWH